MKTGISIKIYNLNSTNKHIFMRAMQGGIWLRVEHVFTYQISQMGLFVRTVGITRATMRGYRANITYNMCSFLLLEKLYVSA